MGRVPWDWKMGTRLCRLRVRPVAILMINKVEHLFHVSEDCLCFFLWKLS